MPRALMAKLHSWVSMNCLRWPSFITANTVSRVCSGLREVLVTGMIRPLTFIEGGTPAVMNRSEPPFSTISLSRSSNSIVHLEACHCAVAYFYAAFYELGGARSGALIPDTPRVRPCSLVRGHPWPQTVWNQSTRPRLNLSVGVFYQIRSAVVRLEVESVTAIPERQRPRVSSLSGKVYFSGCERREHIREWLDPKGPLSSAHLCS